MFCIMFLFVLFFGKNTIFMLRGKDAAENTQIVHVFVDNPTGQLKYWLCIL